MATIEQQQSMAKMKPPLWSRLRPIVGDQLVVLILIYVAMVIFFTANESLFFSTGVYANILNDWAPLVLITLGQTYVIVSGGIDISVGANIGFSGVVAATVMRDMTEAGWSPNVIVLVGVLVAAAVGTGVGLVNASLINRFRIVPFIATLATLAFFKGMSIVITSGPIAGGPSETVIGLGSAWLGPFSKAGLLVVVVCVIAWLFLHKARFGRYTFAIGSNSFAALAAGINVKRHTTKVYALSGLLAGLAGMYYYVRLGTGSPTSGNGAELAAIAATVIGGASLAGGVGRLECSAVGALILSSIFSGLLIIGVKPEWNQPVVGVLIALAAGMQAIVSRKSAR